MIAKYDDLHVLAALVRRPTGVRFGGAVNAARDLSRYVARIIPIDFVEMADSDRSEPWEGNTYYYRLGYHSVPRVLRHYMPLLRAKELNAFMFSRIPQLVTRGDYSVIHIFNLHPIWAAAQIAYTCRRVRKPYVLACHGLHEMANLADLRNWRGARVLAAYIGITLPLQYLIKNSALLYASSPADIPVLESLGAKIEKIRVVPNGVDPAYLQPVPQSRIEKLRAKYSLPPGIPVLLFVGQLKPTKGVDVLIKALTKVDAQWQLVVVGPQDNFPEMTTKVKNLAQETGLASRIRFTGAVPFADLLGLHQMADIFVLPSLSDTFPLAILEAMSKAKPVVATRVGGIPYQVGEEAGILTTPGDINELAAAIRTLLERPDLRLAMGQAAHARLMSQFTWERAARLAVEGYIEVAAEYCAR